MDKIKAPFTKEQVEALNNYQQNAAFHVFTCCSHNGCERRKQPNEGALVASEEGWKCPCGAWTQDWAWEFMADGKSFLNNNQ